jgi:LPXTG-site transpeptidase (sortase) family protein
MKKKKSAIRVFGAALFLIGLAIVVLVAMTILVPPRLPEGYIAEAAHIAEPPLLTNAAMAQVVDQAPDVEGEIGVGLASDLTAENEQTEPLRHLPAANLVEANRPGSESPAQMQSDQFASAMGKAAGDPVDLGYRQPVWISIPAIGVDAPIEAVGVHNHEGEDDQAYLQWVVPDGYVVGWHHTSAPLHAAGNTVLNGHNNMSGAVFKDLVDLEPGDSLILYDEDGSYEYEVTQRVLFEEKGKSMRERNFNARWMMPTSDERLTLISCWPFETNSHRVVVVAQPANVVGT